MATRDIPVVGYAQKMTAALYKKSTVNSVRMRVESILPMGQNEAIPVRGRRRRHETACSWPKPVNNFQLPTEAGGVQSGAH